MFPQILEHCMSKEILFNFNSTNILLKLSFACVRLFWIAKSGFNQTSVKTIFTDFKNSFKFES